MSMKGQDFMKDPHFHPDTNHWWVDEDAPEWVKEEFEKFMKACEEAEKQGICL